MHGLDAEPRLTLKKQQMFCQIMAKFRINFDNHFFTNYGEGALAQPVFSCSKLTIETIEKGVKYVQS